MIARLPCDESPAALSEELALSQPRNCVPREVTVSAVKTSECEIPWRAVNKYTQTGETEVILFQVPRQIPAAFATALWSILMLCSRWSDRRMPIGMAWDVKVAFARFRDHRLRPRPHRRA